MDNGAIISSDLDYLKWSYDQLPEIFGKYKFEVQKYMTNNLQLQEVINGEKVFFR